ncbi:putative threonine--tRNA ligase 2, cytoplasmic [Microtus ochrogaster]|uniref:threonine--tRNA ligase n=1 Tax=Microtus ochrogaster TaxID=79684 RepID=A0A8J6KRZ5_MICOH|nr:putative threonine--tRNA ligase 2, cytoplasmic [Microtus ochrogaster]
MAAQALAAQAVASRLQRQEEDIRRLCAEVQRLRDEQLRGPELGQAEGTRLTREVAQLRAENRDLHQRLSGLRLRLAEQHGPGAGRMAAQEPPTQSQEKETRKKRLKESEPDREVKQPGFIKERLMLFETLKTESQLLPAAQERKNASSAITVRVAGGKTVQGERWRTTPFQVAADISRELAENAVIAKVNGILWDLDRPLEGDSTVELLMFDNEEAQAVYWHSSAHILGEAMELYYGGHLCYGPPIENGFYYDMFIEDRVVSSTELSALENICKSIIKEKQPFERLEVSKDSLLEMFKNSSTYWEGNPEMETLQRIYGISFPDSKMMKGWEKFQEEAKSRDHRKIGKEEYHRRNFTEVISPNMYNSKLWETSGHWQHYSNNMFTFDIEKDTFALKPMNCPGHCLMFANRPRSWREMPVRFADFGVLHRNELSGTLSGLTRVRRFQQDDAHIFCMVEQIDIKIKDAIGRYHQCATIQLDFQLPIRFNLTYVSKDGDEKNRPVIIHRAILGSVERMIAILSENYGGKWPLWLSPRQVMVIPVGPTCEDYALQVSKECFEEGFMADVDLDDSCTLNKKIRNAQLAQYNFILGTLSSSTFSDTLLGVLRKENKKEGNGVTTYHKLTVYGSAHGSILQRHAEPMVQRHWLHTEPMVRCHSLYVGSRVWRC